MAVGLVGPYNAVKSQTTSKTIVTFADVGAGNIAVIYGTSISLHRQLEIRECLKQCVKALVEAGFPKPVAVGSYYIATLPIDQGKGQVAVSEELAVAIPNEGNITVAYSDTFDNVPASSLNLDVAVANLTDELLKDVLNAS